ncbi:hypothetical protein RFI_13588 [Reticulomyxa filosa]|uniref:Uncharacterized protein n=1 Tax=Reticulomyxa filosa TaxID=46433 RepID=X6NBC2_RETFI|nr:hypothetical protein RFI_13588 [Reticulomyxa filosa]|eukprot:ETO23590.1 hypothetical protein RFI_13588 [Reticulomyxa filosa]
MQQDLEMKRKEFEMKKTMLQDREGDLANINNEVEEAQSLAEQYFDVTLDISFLFICFCLRLEKCKQQYEIMEEELKVLSDDIITLKGTIEQQAMDMEKIRAEVNLKKRLKNQVQKKVEIVRHQLTKLEKETRRLDELKQIQQVERQKTR